MVYVVDTIAAATIQRARAIHVRSIVRISSVASWLLRFVAVMKGIEDRHSI